VTREQAELAYAAHSQTWRQFATVLGGRVVDRDGVCVAMTFVDVPEYNPGLVVARPTDAAAAVRWGIEVRRTAGVPGGGYDVPTSRYPRVEKVFADLGYSVLTSRPMMVCPVEDVRGPRDTTLRVSPVTDERTRAAWIATQVAGFEAVEPVARATSVEALTTAPGSVYAVGWVGDEPVASATSVVSGRTVAVFGVTTVPALRGRGYGAAITAWVVEAGRRCGADLAWLQASAMGEPLYARMGFRPVEDYAVWTGPDG
jgi:GNAT superfamily N-acetyltransferase